MLYHFVYVSAKDVIIPAHGKGIVPTDLSIQCPEGLVLSPSLSHTHTHSLSLTSIGGNVC